MTHSQEAQATGWARDFTLVWLSRFGFFFALHQIQPILPLYLKQLGASSTAIGAIFSAFAVTATVARVPAGFLMDRFGRKPFLVAGIAVFAASNLGYFWAASLFAMAFLRAVQGVGWSGCTTATGTITADIVPERRRGELIGYSIVANNLAAALAPMTGFALYHGFGSEAAFLAGFGVSVVSLVFALAVREPEAPPHGPPVPRSWIESFMVFESLVPAVVVGFLTFCQGGLVTFIPLYSLQVGLDNPGIWFLVYAAALILCRPVAGPLSDRLGRRSVILPGFALVLSGLLMLALAPSPAWLLGAAFLMGLGFGSTHPALMTVAVDQSSPQRRGASIAQFQVFFDLGMGLGALVLGTFLDLVDQNFSAMYLAATGAAVAGLALYLYRS